MIVRNNSTGECVMIVDPKEPFKIARQFLADRHRDSNGILTLRRYLKSWWVYTGYRYEEFSEEKLRAELYLYLDQLRMVESRKDGEEVVPYRPDRKKVGDVIAALVAETLVGGEMPRWLDDRPAPRSQDVIAFSNGLIDAAEYCVGRVNLMPSTPAWFSTVACP